MVGTILITGANGSLGMAFCDNLLARYPQATALLTVRDASASDVNTSRLRQIMKKHVTAEKTVIEELDLSSFAGVRSYANSVRQRVSSGELPPISAIVLNAFTWDLLKTFTKTKDGIEKSIEVNHLSQLMLSLLLADVLDKTRGARIVFLGSTTHDITQPNPMRDDKFMPGLPNDLSDLFNPQADAPGTEAARGFQRYANSKICAIMCMHKLNRVLERNPAYSNVVALAMDPGGMPDSRCFADAPRSMRYMMGAVSFMMPVLKPILPPDVRSTTQAGKILVDITVDDRFKGSRGYFTGLEKAEGSKESRDVGKQDAIWKASVQTMRLKEVESILQGVV